MDHHEFESAPTDLIRFTVVPPEATFLALGGVEPDLAISSDGTQVVYESTGGGLNLQPLDQLVGAPLRGGEGGAGPFFRRVANGLGSRAS